MIGLIKKFLFMKKVLVVKKLIILIASIAVASCDPDNDSIVETSGSVSFFVAGAGPGVGSTVSLAPEKLIVSIEDIDGKTIADNKVYTLTQSNGGYATENIVFETGQYRITKYLVISGTTAAFASPRAGAEKAGLIEKPLPLEFSVAGSKSEQIEAKLVAISSQDTPQLFGYPSFGYDVPDAPSTEQKMNVRVKLEMIIGGIYYPNIDAEFHITGFDIENKAVWEQTFAYAGAEPNDISIKSGLHRYTFEARKWGHTLTQTFLGVDLWEGRVREGAVPLTRVFQKQAEPKKLYTMVTSWSKNVNGVVTMEPISRARYEYSDGRIYLINNSRYSPETKRFVDDSQSEFIYDGGKLKQIVTYLAGEDMPNSEDNYTYDEKGRATHIQHKTLGAGTTEVDITYPVWDRTVVAKFSHTNGNGFEYNFVTQYGSVKNDRTMRGSQLCSEGQHTYDRNINPLKHLGYTDYLMRNYSISNRLSENVKYIGCSFPSLVPESYSYEYDDEGYPVKATTHFKGGNAKTQIEYTYLQ